jgi:hypothetical protein
MRRLTGRQLFEEWMFRDVNGPGSNGPHEYTASDGSFVLWVGLLDFDYKCGYLFEIRDDDAECDWLFAWERYGGKNDYDIEWQQTPCHVFAREHRKHSTKALKRFPRWCLHRLEEDRV